jgi:hypothetical protein
MSITNRLLKLCTLTLLAGTTALAQNQLQVTINGSCSTLDANGKIVAKPINNQTLLKDFAKSHGLSSTSSFTLAYHIRGNDLGDTIDVINRTNGASVFTLFGLYFGEDFARPSLRSASGQQVKRIEYIYTDQNSHSLGSALLTTYYWLDGNGNTNSTAVVGQMQYLIAPDATHTNTQVCSASLLAIKPLTFPK